MFNLDAFLALLPRLAVSLPITLLLALVSMAIALVLGMALAVIRFVKVPVLNQVAIAYISFFRGIPTVVQLFLIYFGLPQLIPSMSNLDAMGAAIIGFSLKEASYLAEIFRASLASVDRGQYEAGIASGLTAAEVYRRVILPQAIHNAVPATGNIFISLLKETSVVFVLGLVDMFAEAKLEASATGYYFQTYLVVGLAYWLLVVAYTWFQGRVERVLDRPYTR